VTPDPVVRRTTVLIIGAGAAGLRTAIEVAGQGIDCLVVGKRAHGDAHSRWAAGGINAVLGSLDADDRWDIHAADTLREGHFIADPNAVERLAREAPDRVRELAEWGCDFDRLDDGRINQRFFGAQSFRRTCFVGDQTGEAILRTLVERAGRLNIAWLENICITAILTRRHAVSGAVGIDTLSGERFHFHAAVVVLAAGGCTSIYDRSSSRDDENTGDAMALALRAGTQLRDMEFIQFHPTGMIEPPSMRGRLVTEAVRGEGGHLLNAQGERFMERYAPDQMELAARDVVARANAAEIRAGRGTPAGGVLLDISHASPALIRERLPKMHRQFLEQGIDITSQPMEVAPTAHYPMGGVRVDASCGTTDIAGLLAVGEATAGVHGANRLGGNSLAETVVFGRRTGAFIARQIREGNFLLPQPDHHAVRQHFERLDQLQHSHGDHDPADIISELRTLMWQYAGIIRNMDDLRSGMRHLQKLNRHAHDLDLRGHHDGDPQILRALDLQCMLTTADAILQAAAMRQESRGAHFREDAPESSTEWQCNIVCQLHPDGRLHLQTVPVPATPPAIQRALDEHHTLDYHHLE
jgi:succinate dehydrogenase / fumarate reductase, flavoprotein subunit